ncbi:3-ketoacyl-CoA thiolase, partial [Lacticaseibacillus rhamnosus]|nr:3-ketoacyl-CoA thiolase [Lacticaseibacillus rhamnosus]
MLRAGSAVVAAGDREARVVGTTEPATAPP